VVRPRLPRSIALSFLALLVAGVVALLTIPGSMNHKIEVLRNLPVRLLTRFEPPQGGTNARMTPLEAEAVRALAKHPDAEIVWSTNRGRNHDLYLLDLGTRKLRRLTNDPSVDTHPRFSPDGTRIVFMRRQQTWVSLHDERSWDLFTITADGSDERLLTRGGYAR
jgi:hypothetical protein